MLAVGCGTQKPTAFVDLEAALKAESPAPTVVQTPIETSGWSAGQTVGADEMSAEQLAARTNTDAIREARAAIQKNLEDAKRAATDRLFRQYLKQVTQYRTQETLKIAEQKKLDLEKADERISLLLAQLAEKRHPLVDAVNPYTGYPLPAIDKLVVSEDAPPAVKRLMAEIRTKLERVAELDAEFSREKAEAYADARDADARRRTELEIEIQIKIDELQEQARKETDLIFEKDQSLYEGILVSRPGQASRSLPASSASVGLSVPSASLPQWSTTAEPTAEQRRKELERQLEIFLAARNYRRTTDRTNGVDLTKEFIAWRSEHRLGR